MPTLSPKVEGFLFLKIFQTPTAYPAVRKNNLYSLLTGHPVRQLRENFFSENPNTCLNSGIYN